VHCVCLTATRQQLEGGGGMPKYVGNKFAEIIFLPLFKLDEYPCTSISWS
jgi:hypothetical protein